MADTDLGTRSAPNGSQARSIGQLSGDLVHQMAALMHDELALAKLEMAEKAKSAGMGAGLSGAAVVLVILAVGCLTASVIAALSLAMPVWLAALIVGVVYLIIAGVAALMGRKQLGRAAPPVPEETVESLKEDVEWLKTHARSTRR